MKISRFLLLVIFTGLLSTLDVRSQTVFNFVDTLDLLPNLTPTYKCFDYDNDNDLDIISFEYESIKVHKNLGNDSFSLEVLYSFSYPNFPGEPLDIGDFDNDGDIDVLSVLSYIEPGISTILYKVLILKNTLPDSIGYDTIIINTPNNNSLGYFRVHWNNILNRGKYDSYYPTFSNYSYNFYFVQLDSNYIYFTADSTSNCHCELRDQLYDLDMNNDGYFDIVTSESICFNNGIDSTHKLRLVNRDTTVYSFIPKYYYDFDNDGYFDETGSSFALQIFTNNFYRNNHNDSFVYIPNTQTGLFDSIAFFGKCIFDYNNDGNLDILVTKGKYIYRNPPQIKAENTLYKNLGNFSFTEDTTIRNIGNSMSGGTVWDYDNDGDLDLIIYNYYNNCRNTILYRNDSTPPNTPPTAPVSMWTTIDSTKVIFHWHKATDVETPQATLSYNLMIGTSPKGIDITSPLADTATGFRRVVELGNAQLNNFYILDKRIFNIGDTVYWSVQTIDNGFGYSPFSKENRTIICNRLDAPIFDTICGDDSTFWRGNYYSSTGRHFQTYTSSSLCDSSFALDLKVKPAYLDLEVADICSGSTYSWKGTTYYLPGTYDIPHYAMEGCDSMERLVLNVHSDYTTLLSEDICMGDSILFATNYLSTSGIYIDSLVTNYSCDSIIQLTLTVSPGDTSIMQSGDTLFALQQNALYRWWNCDKQQFVYSANQSYFIPYENGYYAAEITANGCSYLTQCYEITGLSLNDNGIKNLKINLMPNPSDGEFYLELTAPGKQEYQIVIFDALGKEVYNRQVLFENYQKLKLNLKPEGSGVYQLRIVSDENVLTRRFIIR